MAQQVAAPALRARNARPAVVMVTAYDTPTGRIADDAVRNAGVLVRGGAAGVKLEGGRVRVPVVRALVDAQIPVMGHLGLTPQSVHAMGGYRVQGQQADAAATLLTD